MRTRISLAAIVLTLAGVAAGTARADELMSPYGGETIAQPLDPYTGAPVAAPSPTAPPYGGYYVYPAGRQPTYYPPASACCTPCATTTNYYMQGCGRSYVTPVTLTRPLQRERIRRFSLGVHGTILGLNQRIGNEDLVLGGAGLQFRIRSKGRFGLELKQDFLRGQAWDGEFVRTSFPFSVAFMFYIFPNQDTRHFNLYGLAGFGVMWDNISLYNQNRNRVTQDFLEFTLQAGLGAELRFKWFAIAADFRALGLFLAKDARPASYYEGVSGGPVPDKSVGMQGNLYVNFWF